MRCYNLAMSQQIKNAVFWAVAGAIFFLFPIVLAYIVYGLPG